MKKLLIGAALAASMLAAAPAANAAVLVNGSFEEGTNPGSFLTLGNGNTDITGWTVGGNGIDYIGTYWKASQGVRSLDLAALDQGGVSQTFATIVGREYVVSFDLAGNPDGGLNQKAMVTSAGLGQLPALFTFDVGPGNTHDDMGWQSFTYKFTAQSTSSTLNFSSLTRGPYGPALDNVGVTLSAVPEPATWAMMIIGFTGAGVAIRRRRRDDSVSFA